MGCFYLQKPIFDIPARAILSPIRSATYLIKFSATSSSDKNFTGLFAVSQLLSDTLRKISWKIVVVGSCYRWFRGNLCFSETYFPPASPPRLSVYPRIGKKDCNLSFTRCWSFLLPETCVYFFLISSRPWVFQSKIIPGGAILPLEAIRTWAFSLCL